MNHARGAYCIVSFFILAIIVVAYHKIDASSMESNPSRIYSRHASELDQYAEVIDLAITENNHQIIYPIPDCIKRNGLRSVRKIENIYVFEFSFFVDDPVPQLWCCPAGFEKMPEGVKVLSQDTSRKWQVLGSKWACSLEP